ncbi:MAG: cyclic nucleotide-binding domain-containing protein [Sphingobacteriales bacterium]|nr:cyclic nucleotide-binding domain-containing protein [Sphingobacteriales bacterium]
MRKEVKLPETLLHMELLIAYLHSIARMSPALEAHLRNILQRMVFEKGTVILREGAICRHIFFIEVGLVQIYRMEDVIVTRWILEQKDIFISPRSFFRQIASEYTIIALENCICWSITRKQLEDVCRLFPEFLLHRAYITEEYYCRSEDRHDEMQLMPAVDKYAALAEKRENLLYCLPVGVLASYIGVGESTFYAARKEYHDRRRNKK